MSTIFKPFTMALLCLPIIACAKQSPSTDAPAPAPKAEVSQITKVPAPEPVAEQSAPMASEADAPEANTNWIAGEHYQIIASPDDRAAADGIEIAEVFMYGCPHCFSFEPFIQSWKAKHLKSDMNFVRLPATYNKIAGVHARAFYALEQMQALSSDVHNAIFKAIHIKNNPLRSMNDIAKVVAAAGVDADAFKAQYASFSVDAKARETQSRVQRYQVNSVPALVINGRYMANGSMAGNEANLTSIVNYLVDLERTRLAK